MRPFKETSVLETLWLRQTTLGIVIDRFKPIYGLQNNEIILVDSHTKIRGSLPKKEYLSETIADKIVTEKSPKS